MKFFESYCRMVFTVLLCLLTTAIAAARDVHDLISTEGMTVEVLGVYFTPPASAAAAIVRAVDASEREVLVQAYGFTHNAIAQALVRAHHRGVVVRVLLDKKSASTNGYVMGVLADDQINVRQDGMHAIAHNKVMVIDESVVITGSFNFTNSAATRNAENLLILKSSDLALRYKSAWRMHWEHSQD
jgi:phosphatidylserine/phosphatidylglycerophosphate/cardiolipin synthase-like enzyme